MGVIAAVLLGLYALPMLWDVQHSAAVVRLRAQVDALTSGYAVCTPGRLGVYTVDGEDSQVECVRVQGDVVADVGERDAITEQWTKQLPWPLSVYPFSLLAPELNVHEVDEDSIVVPGLTDSHCHVLEYGAFKQIPLEKGKSIPDVVKHVRNYIMSNDEIFTNMSKPVLGWGWDHTAWPEKRFPTAADLDADPIIRGRPVILTSKDGHAIWVSQRVLDENIANIPDEVPGGVIYRDKDGKPTGTFLDSAIDVIPKPSLTDADLRKRLMTAVRDAHAYGLTSVHDAALLPESLAFFKRQAEANVLPLRVFGMKYFNEEDWSGDPKDMYFAFDNHLVSRSVKIFADGALRTGGAALYEPYSDNPSSRGAMRIDPELLAKVVPKLLANGWQVNVHAIGDRANGLVLDAFEAALTNTNISAVRPRLEHAQLMTDKDIERLGRLGVIASVQPTHVIDDMWYAEDRLGPSRIRGLYAFRSMLNAGARITLGSDFPVETMNPLAGFYAAITRLTYDGRSPQGGGGWFPEQALTRREALRGLTIEPAHASFSEAKVGSLEVGKKADFVVLSRDIMTVPVEEFMGTRVLATVIDGRVVYGGL
ncbi:amidohydrolase family-domain-containing protein [Schizophyllum commune]